jgi:hypothetical protein
MTSNQFEARIVNFEEGYQNGNLFQNLASIQIQPPLKCREIVIGGPLKPEFADFRGWQPKEIVVISFVNRSVFQNPSFLRESFNFGFDDRTTLK